jgi:putative pyruvate formate lyase activating enzyme
MRCCYCQNYRISTLGAGREVSDDEFEKIVLRLQDKDALNINLVSPTPYTLLLLPLLQKIKKKLKIPIVWNSNAYEKVETLKLLEGIVDIYLPDFRYWNDDIALQYSGITHYRENAQAAIKEMMRQTGNLRVDDDGVAIFGTMIRLLVLPKNINEIDKAIQWIYNEFGNDVYLSLMSQYYPAYKAQNFIELKEGVTKDDYSHVYHIMEGLGFENGFCQEPASTPEWTPEFN